MTRFQAWRTAARLHTLPAAVVPVLVGGGLASGEGVFRTDAFLWALVGALSIQVAANFANDASDAHRGADTADRVGPPRMVALGVISARRMWVAAWIAIAVAGVAGVFLTLIAGPVILVIGAASVVAMLGYVGGPYPYGYHGLGEVFVFTFFGLVATVGARFVHDGTAPQPAWLLAIPVGFLVTAILVVNNYRDIDTDAAAGKRTLAVIIGPLWTRWLYVTLVVGAFAIAVVFALSRLTPVGTALVAVVAPFAAVPIRIVMSQASGGQLIRALKLTASTHLWAGVALAIGASLRL